MYDVFQLLEHIKDRFEIICNFFLTQGLELGEPLEMTEFRVAYKDDQNDTITMIADENVSMVVATFPRYINSVRLMPCGQRLSTNDYTYDTYLSLFLNTDGICDIQIPMMFDELIIHGSRDILSADQAVEALEQLFAGYLLPNFSQSQREKPIIDYVVLEYAPVQTNSDGAAFTLIPVWSFYILYDDDEMYGQISLCAYTGEHVF